MSQKIHSSSLSDSISLAVSVPNFYNCPSDHFEVFLNPLSLWFVLIYVFCMPFPLHSSHVINTVVSYIFYNLV
jgi:hypothetical protein